MGYKRSLGEEGKSGIFLIGLVLINLQLFSEHQSDWETICNNTSRLYNINLVYSD